MNFIADFSRLETLSESNKTWSLLRAKTAPLIISFLKNIFAVEREVDYEYARANLKEFLSQVKAKLDTEEQKTTANDYIQAWISRGLLIELNDKLTMTDAAQKAIEFVEKLETRIVSTSATHLEILLDAVQKLYINVGTDKRLRMREIDSQIKKLQQEKKLIRENKDYALDDYSKRERVKAIYDMAANLPSDFRRLEEETVEAAKQTRTRIILDDSTKGQLIEDVLKYEEEQRRTDYGQAYEGFFKLICQEELCSKFKDQMEYILTRSFVEDVLNKKQKNFLHNLVNILVDDCDRIRSVRARIDANLRSYLESGEFKENKRVNKLISMLEKEAVNLKELDINMYTKELPVSIEKNKVIIRSVETLSKALKVPDRAPELSEIEMHENQSHISQDILNQLDGVRLSDVRKKIISMLGKTAAMSVGEIISRSILRHGLEEVVAFVRVAREINTDETAQTEEIIVKLPSEEGEKKYRITLPKIMLSSRMIQDHTNDRK
ncbi:MAG: DUF3375 family protein [Succinivibrio sp.]